MPQIGPRARMLVPRRLAIGILTAAAAILISGAAAAQAATIAPPPGSTGGLYALLKPTIQTVVHNDAHAAVTSVVVGSTVHPWAKVSGSASTPTGGVAVFTWHNLNCSGTWYSVYGGVLTNGVIDATFLPYTSNDEADVSYRVHYDGNLYYAAADGPCVGASFVKANPAVSLVLHNSGHRVVTSVPYGTAVHGLVTVSGSVDTPTGTASISRFPSSDCSGISTTIGPSSLAADGTLHSAYQFTFPGPGTWSFRAHYFGDSTYNAKNSACITFIVTKATPTFTTVLHDANHAVPDSVLVGQDVHAKATLSSPAGTPTGSVSVKRYSDPNCTSIESAPTIAAAPTMDPAGPAYTTPSPKTESWRLTYSGDSNFSGVAGPCMAMTWKATPTVAASLHNASHAIVTSVYVGSPIHLDVTVTGGFGTPTGQVTFRVSTNSDCDNPQPFGSRTLSGGAVDDAGVDYVPPSAGTYSFEAVYGGSSTYQSRISPCKVLTVTPAPTPTPTPKPSPKGTPKPTAAPVVQPTSQPGATLAPSSAPTADPAISATPDASSAPAPSPTAAPLGSAAAGGPAVASDAPSGPGGGDPSAPAAATDGSGPGLGLVAAGLLLLLIAGLVAWWWSRRTRRA